LHAVHLLTSTLLAFSFFFCLSLLLSISTLFPYTTLFRSYTSVTVATVDLGFLLVVFWSIEIAGDKPSIVSTSGLSICPKNCLAYALKDSTYLRCPSAYIVSKASDDLPEPDKPVITISLFLCISISSSFKLLSPASFTTLYGCLIFVTRLLLILLTYL